MTWSSILIRSPSYTHLFPLPNTADLLPKMHAAYKFGSQASRLLCCPQEQGEYVGQSTQHRAERRGSWPGADVAVVQGYLIQKKLAEHRSLRSRKLLTSKKILTLLLNFDLRIVCYSSASHVCRPTLNNPCCSYLYPLVYPVPLIKHKVTCIKTLVKQEEWRQRWTWLLSPGKQGSWSSLLGLMLKIDEFTNHHIHLSFLFRRWIKYINNTSILVLIRIVKLSDRSMIRDWAAETKRLFCMTNLHVKAAGRGSCLMM